ncbi:MAG: Holliday junction resolvase RuvX [Bacilli bacterium]|jgi:putative Holliday junction resolvase|nr:Holliday junction resolvase RuvX [Bacilli bacterium]MCH4210327.1 Holliday junction resolvase RuvX [Bacilli bacterium]MCH4228916.1 Holliday junction resolvase RuvX [Bacilli bacterium]MCH4278105.1 Holliday junction resolvase RuvX [Bacilli bacterium]MCI2055419.1 Holliday junction resolvase RuvX [Bacilli bacterium]
MKKVAGLDLGTRSCGIAVSDVLGIAHGREEYRFLEGAYKQAVAHIIEFLHNEGIDEVALGYPLNMDGSAGESAHRSERFKEELLEVDPKLKITLVDERLTTVVASKRLLEADISRKKRHAVIDQQAAQVILESYLNQKEGGNL